MGVAALFRFHGPSGLHLEYRYSYDEVVFHPDATAHFNKLGDTLRDHVRAVKKTPRTASRYTPYPVGRVGPEDVIGKVAMSDHIVDGLGREVGRVWTIRGDCIGLVGDDYQELRSLAGAMAKTPALQGRVDVAFLVNEISLWLQATLEGTAAEALVTHISMRCQEAIKEYDIWVPLFRVHASDPFPIGDVLFQKITPVVMERFFVKPASTPVPEAARIRLERLRSQLQNHLAACVKVTGEKKTAQAIARSKAEAAVALVRFLSPAKQLAGHPPGSSRRAGGYSPVLRLTADEVSLSLFPCPQKFTFWDTTLLPRGTFWVRSAAGPLADAQSRFPPARLLHPGGRCGHVPLSEVDRYGAGVPRARHLLGTAEIRSCGCATLDRLRKATMPSRLCRNSSRRPPRRISSYNSLLAASTEI